MDKCSFNTDKIDVFSGKPKFVEIGYAIEFIVCETHDIENMNLKYIYNRSKAWNSIWVPLQDCKGKRDMEVCISNEK